MIVLMDWPSPGGIGGLPMAAIIHGGGTTAKGKSLPILRLEQSTATGCTESSDMRRAAPDIGLVGMVPLQSSFASVDSFIMKILMLVTGPKMFPDVRSIPSARKTPMATFRSENPATATGPVKGATPVFNAVLLCSSSIRSPSVV